MSLRASSSRKSGIRLAVRVAIVPIDMGLRAHQVAFVHVADGDNLRVGLAEERAHVAGALASKPDAAHHNPVARRRSPVAPHRRGRHDMEEGRARSHSNRRLDKIATIYSFVFRHTLVSLTRTTQKGGRSR